MRKPVFFEFAQMLFCILWHQVYAHAHKLISVAMRGLDELGHPTGGTFSISPRDEVKHTCWLQQKCKDDM